VILHIVLHSLANRRARILELNFGYTRLLCEFSLPFLQHVHLVEGVDPYIHDENDAVGLKRLELCLRLLFVHVRYYLRQN